MKLCFSFSSGSLTRPLFFATVSGLVCGVSLMGAAGDSLKFQPNPNAGPGAVIVHGKFGGNIFGFEIDPNGTEGLLCEAVGNPDGTVTAAVETFKQGTGKII